ncbi:putative ribonuclease H-like domain-containing protein [Tanacetum coccineum]
METQKLLLKDEDGEEVDVHLYRSMIGFFDCIFTSPRTDYLCLYDYAGASLDRKSTTGGCQFLGCRLISWQCKKQTVVANSITEAKYASASSCVERALVPESLLLSARAAISCQDLVYRIYTKSSVKSFLSSKLTLSPAQAHCVPAIGHAETLPKVGQQP